MLVISSSSLNLLLCWVYVALKASVINKLQGNPTIRMDIHDGLEET